MADRRQGDRREKENGVIKIKFRDAVIYIVLITIFLISFVINIIQYKTIKDLRIYVDDMESNYIEDDYYEDDYSDDYIVDDTDEEIDTDIDE